MAESAGMAFTLDAVLDSLDGDDFAAAASWLRRNDGGKDGTADPLALLVDPEKAVDEPRPPAKDDPHGIRSVGVIGGGTAGYLTALALNAKRPWLDVTLVESSSIPIIGVGEATVPSMVAFLHHYLGIDSQELYEKVRPTWKLGIRFDWGPRPEGFMAPFDWDANSVGVLGSLATSGSINDFTLLSMMMAADRTPIFKVDGRYESLLKYLRFAYHLDNARFVGFLAELAVRRGVRHIDAKITEVVARDERVDHLRTDDGKELRFDFYVDCSGFRSMILGKALKTAFHSYETSLFTDSAVTGNLTHHGHLKPYTSAITMDAGWCWNIPTPESDHLGYVYSSSAISPDAAADELARRFPGISDPRFVRFRVGRHEAAWRGNVMAIGNSYAFVEPLESSGLHMITLGVLALANALPASFSDPSCSAIVNNGLAGRWDALRWFLSLHYRFNTRRNTPFWQRARTETDVSGIQPLLDCYAGGAPLSARAPFIRGLAQNVVPTIYGLAGIDTILLGQQVPARMVPQTESADQWRARKAGAEALVRNALPQAEALAAFTADPRLHDELLRDDDSWASARLMPRLGFG
jgi:tryptophan halogenase